MATRAPARPGNGLLVLLILALILAAVFLLARRGGKNVSPPAAAAGLEVPAGPASDEAVRHRGYSLGFRASARQAAWVAYLLTGTEMADAHEARTNNFRPDDAVSGSADNGDYEGSGYDRGHLAPAEDLSYSAETMSESFFYSNMSPQLPAFNRGVWRRLESLVRYWASEYDSIYIVTGPVLAAGDPVIGPHRVAVPALYYKAVLVYGKEGVQAIAFLLRNEASAKTLKSFAVPVDEVERVTGLDLFHKLPDEIENRIEQSVDKGAWRWKRG